MESEGGKFVTNSFNRYVGLFAKYNFMTWRPSAAFLGARVKKVLGGAKKSGSNRSKSGT